MSLQTNISTPSGVSCPPPSSPLQALDTYLSREEPEEEVAVVSLVHCEVASITLVRHSRERTDHALPLPW